MRKEGDVVINSSRTAPPAENRGESGGHGNGGMRDTVLVVDDSAVSRATLTQMLSPRYNVLEAANGRIALKLLQTQREKFAAMLLDLVMPAMDGYVVLEELQKNDLYRNFPV
ncbi:MAG: response regulator, partial [Oscillospiraceae bacterium]